MARIVLLVQSSVDEGYNSTLYEVDNIHLQ